MRLAVARHVYRSYADLAGVWIGLVCEAVRALGQRTAVVFLFALAASAVAAGDTQSAKALVILILVVYAGGALIGASGDLLAARSTDRRYKGLLERYHARMISKDLAFYRDTHLGGFSNLLRQHLDGTINIVRILRGDVVPLFTTLVAPLVILVVVSWKLGAFLTGVVITLVGYVIWASSVAKRLRKQALVSYKKLNGEVTDQLENIVPLRASGLEADAVQRVVDIAEEEGKLFWRRHKLTSLLEFPRVLITGIGVTIGCLLILEASGRGEVAPVALTVITFTYMLQVTGMVAELPDLVHRLDEHIARVDSSLEILSSANETVVDQQSPLPLNIANGAIRFQDVSFDYRSGSQHVEVVKHLNLEIGGGEHVGLVGLNGAGKSTLIHLLMRFADVTRGQLLIDGTDIRQVSQHELRAAISYVPQDQVLLHRSIRENIGFYEPRAGDDQIVEAAMVAGAHEFICELEKGYESIVGDRGSRLSGGQRQRILLARAILKPSRIVIWDEATSALDGPSELAIQERLLRKLRSRTVIVISHRLTTVCGLDWIAVMENGQIVETGPHEELVILGGAYARLWKHQSGLERFNEDRDLLR